MEVYDMGWIISIFAIIGAILNVQKSKWGFAIWCVTNPSWIIFDVYLGIYSQIPIWIVFWILAVYGYYKWSD